MKDRRAQGALEFLMTYGWAFLVILIMIAALMYFGILDPSRFLPERCAFNSPTSCKEDSFVVTANTVNTIRAGITNTYSTDIYIYDFNISSDQAGGAIVCDAVANTITLGTVDVRTSAADTKILPAGQTQELLASCTAGDKLSKGRKAKFTVTYKWYPVTTTAAYAKTVTNEIYGNAQ